MTKKMEGIHYSDHARPLRQPRQSVPLRCRFARRRTRLFTRLIVPLCTLSALFTVLTPQVHAQIQEPVITFVTSGAFEVRASNPNLIALSGRMTLTLTDVSSSPGSPIQYVLPANSTDVLIASLTVTGPNPAASYSNTYSPGDYTAVPDDYVYGLPFAIGESYRVDQGEGGSFSHQPSSPQNHLAIDFGMAVGTPIHAIRDGLVFNIVESFGSGGNDPSLASQGNFVQILHSDGTYAEYVHMRRNGVTVEVGDMVERGDFIGFSGDSGYVNGAHLHFAVIRNNSDNNPTSPFRSVSMRFDTAQGSGIVLQEGTTYSHPAAVATAPRIFFDGEELSWTVPAGTSFRVEASTDLENWSPVSQILESTGMRMSATSTRSNPVELYRLNLMP